MPAMIKVIVHWIVFLAVVLNVVSCIFTGQLALPDNPY